MMPLNSGIEIITGIVTGTMTETAGKTGIEVTAQQASRNLRNIYLFPLSFILSRQWRG
jgi:hypothetical protein